MTMGSGRRAARSAAPGAGEPGAWSACRFAALAAARARARTLALRSALASLLAASGAAGVAGPLAGQDSGEDGGGSTESLFLLLPVGAQGVGIGRAMTALPSQEGAFWNPAGLAGEEDRRALVYRGDQLAGPATAISVLFPWRRVGTFGLSYVLLDIGDQELRDDFGSVLGSISIRNHLAVASYAASFPGGIDAGLNLKLLQFRVACRGQCPDLETTSSAYAVDVGIQAQPFANIPLRLGWMLAHAGTELQVINHEQSDPLPTRMRLAAAYEVIRQVAEDVPMDLWLTIEAEDRVRDPGSPSMYLGLAFSAAELLHVRAGYVAGNYDQTNGASVGVGFGIDRFDLHLAKSLTRSIVTGESQPIHVTLGASF